MGKIVSTILERLELFINSSRFNYYFMKAPHLIVPYNLYAKSLPNRFFQLNHSSMVNLIY